MDTQNLHSFTSFYKTIVSSGLPIKLIFEMFLEQVIGVPLAQEQWY